jgi:phage shock protein E
MNRIIIDVREPFEFDANHASSAINLPLSKLMNDIENIPDNAEIVLYCNSGSRSGVAMNILRQMGYSNVVNGINIDQIKARYDIQ